MDQSNTTQTLRIRLTVHGKPLELTCTASDEAASPSEILPLARSLSDELVRRSSTASVEATGRPISCRAHCGACCRQLVPISKMEARAIALRFEEMPEPRRSIVRERFASIRERLVFEQLFEKLINPSQVGNDIEAIPLRTLGLKYFSLGMACPFLEDESCSIYSDRPVACREYLVDTPPEYCATADGDKIDVIPMAAKVSRALHALEQSNNADATREIQDWVPLSLALDWCARSPADDEAINGKLLIQRFFEALLHRPMK